MNKLKHKKAKYNKSFIVNGLQYSLPQKLLFRKNGHYILKLLQLPVVTNCPEVIFQNAVALVVTWIPMLVEAKYSFKQIKQMAQLVEQLLTIRDVRSSNPVFL